ncbi:MAG TPA: hypothetical protein VF614_05340, partial [Chthoniobacteraceae bacterium]
MALTIIVAVLAWIAPTSFAQVNVGDRDPTFPSPTLSNGVDPGIVKAMVHTTAGTVIVGDFTSVNGVPRGRIARLLPDGSLDPEFAAGAGADGAINAVALAGDHFVLGGEFTSFDGSPRSYLARVFATTGRVDKNYAISGPNGVVHAIVASGSSVYIGGEFTAIGAVSRNRLAYLNGTTGAADSTFNPPSGANGPVYALGRSTFSSISSQLFVGGNFTSLGGQSRTRLASVDSRSGSVTTFNANVSGPNGPVLTILVSDSTYNGSNSIYVGGSFSAVDGLGRGNIARYASSIYSYYGPPALDPSFNIFTDGPVRRVGQASSSAYRPELLIGGDFLHVNATPKKHIARLVTGGSSYSYYSPSGLVAFNLDMTFGSGTGPNGPVRAIVATGEGKVLIGGSFAEVSGAAAAGLARLYGSSGSAPPSIPTIVAALAVGASRNYLEWGYVSYASKYSVERRQEGQTEWTPFEVTTAKRVDLNLEPATTYHYRVRSMNSNGSSEPSATVALTTLVEEWNGAGALDPSYAPPAQAFSSISSAVLLRDGRILIAGSFTTVLGVPRSRVAVLLPDLTLDVSFDPGVGADSTVEEAIELPDGKILIRGYFSKVSDVSRPYLARLNLNGSLDSSFTAPTGISGTYSMAIQGDGKILIGGYFTHLGGLPLERLARLNADGTIDETFLTTFDSTVNAVVVDSEQRILVGGSFYRVNGRPIEGVVRLLRDGTIDDSFDAKADTSVTDIALSGNGRILASGSFSTFAGVSRSRMALLREDGSLDPAFN